MGRMRSVWLLGLLARLPWLPCPAAPRRAVLLPLLLRGALVAEAAARPSQQRVWQRQRTNTGAAQGGWGAMRITPPLRSTGSQAPVGVGNARSIPQRACQLQSADSKSTTPGCAPSVRIVVLLQRLGVRLFGSRRGAVGATTPIRCIGLHQLKPTSKLEPGTKGATAQQRDVSSIARHSIDLHRLQPLLLSGVLQQ